MSTLNSVRRFAIMASNEDDIIILTLAQIVIYSEINDAELIYAMHDHLDTILDMKPYDNFHFQPNRDDKESKAVIVRLR